MNCDLCHKDVDNHLPTCPNHPANVALSNFSMKKLPGGSAGVKNPSFLEQTKDTGPGKGVLTTKKGQL